ncbi:hypothetical protein [Roseibium sp. Sym1]|uniref:hypothetical protein n=1 Tax=Roseibium sp. Sym1 TaxID=3016006 RepID=UPI0022B5BC08|nr:hypothetical protein [Roseibium sp. Sym1]
MNLFAFKARSCRKPTGFQNFATMQARKFILSRRDEQTASSNRVKSFNRVKTRFSRFASLLSAVCTPIQPILRGYGLSRKDAPPDGWNRPVPAPGGYFFAHRYAMQHAAPLSLWLNIASNGPTGREGGQREYRPDQQ